ncbi:type II toxin-antitoxin system death-on-curing family toxin [Priestia aryabhattai]|uniref:type II toxin-antitoxin system death-on-curing family toxin n=1 Tax=Priestia aryabhattai TaxID=412384 RepID=UPI003CF2699F
MDIRYLDLEDLEALHDQALEDYGGIPGRPEHKLEGILEMPKAGFLDYEKYPSIIEKAAVYLYYLASGHAFSDGNKRTSYAATFVFLDLNGYDLEATDDEIYDFVLSIANSETRPSFEVAVQWIERHITIQQ